MKKLFIIPVLLSALLAPSASYATGGMGCTIEDENIDFNFEALYSYEDQTRLFQSRLELKPKYKGLPPSLMSLDVSRAKVVQQWMGQKSINLQFTADSTEANAKFTRLTLSMETKVQEDEISYEGEYTLEIQSSPVNGASDAPIVLTGKASCSAG